MRTGLIAAVIRTDAGSLRAELPLAGRSVLAWQVDLLRDLGAERVLCLCESANGDVLRLQHEVEAGGAAFHVLTGFAALPALVRAEDELIILRDGLVPDPAVVRGLLNNGSMLRKEVLCLPSDHPLAAAYPDDFERIDALHHWAGVLVMRGAPVQQLADFPPDADATSVLLRLALQAETPRSTLMPDALAPETWLLADSARAVAVHEQDLIANAAPKAEWRAPLATLAAVLVRRIVPRGLGKGALVSASIALLLALAGVIGAALGMAVGGLAVAGAAAFAGRVSAVYATMTARLRRQAGPGRYAAALGHTLDVLAALALWFALAPWPDWSPLAVCGPLVIGLLRLAAREVGTGLAAIASDRASQLLLLALAAGLGVLPEAAALFAAALTTALLLRTPSH